MVDARGNIGNRLDPRTATPTTEKAQLNLNTQEFDKMLPGIGHILYSMQSQINTLQAALSDMQTKFNAHTHSANATAIVAGQQSTMTTGSSLNVL